MNEKQELFYKKLCGKYATVRFDSGHGIKPGIMVYLKTFNPENEMFTCTYTQETGKSAMIQLSLMDINLRDEKYNLKNILFKGHRTERPDKYGDQPIIELLPDNKSIYLSTTLRSLLLVNQDEFVGFSLDTDTKRIMVFKAKDETEGWQVAGNGRLKSSADWRELNNEYGMIINVRMEAYTDDEHYSGYLFYNLFNEQPLVKDKSGKKTRRNDNPFNDGFETYEPVEQPSINRIPSPTTSVGYGFIDSSVQAPQVYQSGITNITAPRR